MSTAVKKQTKKEQKRIAIVPILNIIIMKEEMKTIISIFLKHTETIVLSDWEKNH